MSLVAVCQEVVSSKRNDQNTIKRKTADMMKLLRKRVFAVERRDGDQGEYKCRLSERKAGPVELMTFKQKPTVL